MNKWMMTPIKLVILPTAVSVSSRTCPELTASFYRRTLLSLLLAV